MLCIRLLLDDIFQLLSRQICAREFVAMHSLVAMRTCGKQGTYAVQHTGAREKGLQPRRKMCTAGLSHPVVKETHACEFVRTASMS